MSPWLALARADRVNVLRDPMLLAASLVALPLGALARFARGPLGEALAAWVDPGTFDALLGSMVLVLPALLAGTVQGFLLLEERDEHVEAAIRATPLGLVGLLRWRLGASLAVGLATSALAWGISGLPVPATLPVGLLVAGLHGPAIALVLTAARDKVQGLALSKVTSIAAVVQVTVLLPGPARWLGAPFPAWWLARGLSDGGVTAMAIAAVLATAICATLVGWRLR